MIFLAYAAYMGFVVFQMDLKSAFLNGKISRKYMSNNHLSLKAMNFPTMCVSMIKLSMGLKQAPKAWYETLLKFLILHKFVRGLDELGVSVNETLFRDMIKSLMYLIASRPDIKISTCLCARKSASVGCKILGGKLACWSAKKQSSVAMSSTEAEYVVTARCCARVFWIKSQLAGYDLLYDKVSIFCGNTIAISISNNPVLHSRTKHIDIGYHCFRDHILKRDIELHIVPTDMQLAYIFTKPLVDPSFTRVVAELGMVNIQTDVPDKKKVEHMTWQTDYCIMKEEMSILRGRKSVPRMNSSEREWKEGITPPSRELLDKEL
nr:hypothetical protein [Tanacetum cinerariifolium]